jgi:hypothetical protein
MLAAASMRCVLAYAKLEHLFECKGKNSSWSMAVSLQHTLYQLVG